MWNTGFYCNPIPLYFLQTVPPPPLFPQLELIQSQTILQKEN